VAYHMPSMHETLSSIPSTTKTNKMKKNNFFLPEYSVPYLSFL
jgi:hypothetical protein